MQSTLYNGDCLEIMKQIPDGSVDMVLTDPPYGTTACKWDSIIPFEPMWEQLKRVTKPNGAIVMTASQPFTSALVMSNPKMFKYCWVWEKTLFSNFALVKKQPTKKHEDICVFYTKQPTYNPQMESGKPYKDKERGRTMGVTGDALPSKKPIDNEGTRYPSSVQKFSNGNNGNVHPTQKPVALMEYLIKTYTQGGETVLDFTMGSGTTGVACKNLNRNFIGIELDPEYFRIAKERIESA
jgi:site-specific DNA-methyltransferase (adenine-specific)